MAGLVASEVMLIRYQVPPLSAVTFFATFGAYFLSQAPDLDHSESVISRYYPFRVLTRVYDRLGFRHRGPTHSLLFVALVYLICKTLLLPDILIWIFVVSYASHLLLDMFNEEGIELLWPVLRLRFKFLPSFLAISSDERSLGQSLLYASLLVLFYFFGLHLAIHILEFVPVIGPNLVKVWNSYVIPELPQFMQQWIFT